MNTQPPLFTMPLPEEPEEKPQRMVLVDKIHFTFEEWALHILHILPLENLDIWIVLRMLRTNDGIIPSRKDYVKQCWNDEIKWKEWCDGVEETNKQRRG